MKTKEELNKLACARHDSGEYAEIVVLLETFGLENLTNRGQFINDHFIASIGEYQPELYPFHSDPIEVSGYLFMEDRRGLELTRGLRVNIDTKEYFITHRLPYIQKTY